MQYIKSITIIFYITFFWVFVWPTLVNADSSMQWPVAIEQPWEKLSSPFGPRLKASKDFRKDFHLGIDIPGTETDSIYAITDGEVFRMYSESDSDSPYNNSGNIVILKHTFQQSFTFHRQPITTYYSFYAHLSSFETNLKAGDTVLKGDTIGYMGNSGSTDFTHLHFEIRVGTTCSLASSCNTVGFDPHINPLTLLPYPEANTLKTNIKIQDKAIQLALRLPRNELDLNKVIIRTFDANDILQEKRVVNFQTRKGFDATSTDALDMLGVPTIVTVNPRKFSTNNTYIKYNYMFPNMIQNTTRTVIVSVFDVHGHRLKTKTYTIQ